MPLPHTTTPRVLKHSRNIHIDFYFRNDGYWDIDAQFVDVKTHDLFLETVVIPAKRPLHNLWMRLTIDPKGTIVDVKVNFEDVPFDGYCQNIHPRYQELIGLNILHSFRKDMHERLNGVNRCTHMNELAEAIPSVAMQVFVFGEEEARLRAEFQKEDERPFHLNACHVMDETGPGVKKFYPRWALKDETNKK